MDFILLVGLLVLAWLYFQMSSRIAALERLLGELGGEGQGDILTERGTQPERRPPARVFRSAAPTVLEAPMREPEPDGEPELDAGPPETLGGLFERLVGGRLLIWIGGIALATAGVFLVRYSIQIGLITPGVQMIIAALFGFLLLGAGELVRGRPGTDPDPRIAQALVGAGILVLYATPYGSLVVYGLLSKGSAALLMAMVAAAALFLSLRHGAPTAMLGLLGGFAVPLLVGERSDSAVPLLAYLALLDIVLFTLAARRGWTWLAASAALLSFGWSGMLLFWPPEDALAAGVFIVALSVAASLIRAGEGWQLAFLRPAAVGLLQLAILVARTDIGLPAWGLYAALAIACFFLAGRRPEYRPLPALALLFALLLLALEALDTASFVPWIAAGITLLFAAGSLPEALRGARPLQAVSTACAAFAGPALVLRLARPEWLAEPAWGGLLALLAAGPLLLAWTRRGDGTDASRVAAAGTALLLLVVAAADLLPDALLAAGWLALAIAAALAARRLGDRGLGVEALVLAGLAALWTAAMVPALWDTLLASLAGDPALAARLPSASEALRSLLLPAPLMLLVWHWLPDDRPRLRSAALAASLFLFAAAGYVLFKQAWGLSSAEDFVARGFAERLLITQALFLAGWMVCAGRPKLPWLDEEQSWRVGTALTAVAAARLLWFDLMLHNPALVDQWVGAWPLANLLLPAYLLSAFWLYRARRGAAGRPRSGLWLALFLLALVGGVMLLVRQLFHGAILAQPGISSAESYGYSLAGLLLSIALLLAGIRLPDKALRVAGLGLLTITILKVFLSDASALEGVLRILSFLGLGIALIGIGKLYTKVLSAEARPAAP